MKANISPVSSDMCRITKKRKASTAVSRDVLNLSKFDGIKRKNMSIFTTLNLLNDESNRAKFIIL
jgi:hypothetical protein